MNTSRKLVGGLIGLLAITQTGCAALGIAMVGNSMTPGAPIDTAQVLDPNVPTVGQPTQPGNTNLTVKVDLPLPSDFQAQYVLSEITQLVVGLVDLNTATNVTPLYFGYEGSVKRSSTTYHSTGNVVSELLGTYAGAPAGNTLTTTQKQEFDRYLYFSISGNDARVSNTRTVTFTNIKPNTNVRAFAIAFFGNGVNKDTNVAGIIESPTLTANSTTPAIALNLNLNRGLVDLGGSVTITPATPSASLQ